MESGAVHEKLLGLDFFEGFTKDEVAIIASAGDLVEAPEGDAIIEEGTNGDYLCILLSGKAEVSKKDSRGDSHHLDWSKPVDLLGELGLLFDHPRSATVRAAEASKYFRLDREAFNRMLADGSTAARKLLHTMAKNLAQRQRDTNQRLIELLEPDTAKVDLSDLKRKFGGRSRYL